MWHVETDFFALAVFLLMFIKEFGMRRMRKLERLKGTAHSDLQGDAFYFVLIFSIISVVIDISSSIAMNISTNWWVYQILMTLYVVSMPLLAAVWVGYAYILIHQNYSLKRLLKGISLMMIPYILFAALALSNPFTGLFFKLSPDMEYERGILFMPVGVGFIMLYSCIGLLLVIFHWKKIRPRFTAALMATFFLFTATLIWVQLANPGWLIINASYAVIYVWCDIAIEDLRRRRLYGQIRVKNKKLEQAVKKANSAANAKSEFLSRMSHDIRTPMNAIIGLNHLSKTETDINVLRDYQDKIDASSKFLLGLINDILDLSKIENGEMTLHEMPFTCEEFKTSIQTVIKPLIDERDIKFVFQMNCGVKCIKVDRLRFSQIFFNLLSNAAKFTPKGGTIEFVSEKIVPSENKKIDDGMVGLRMFVRDNGIGMSEEFLRHIYDPFIQEESELGDKVRGTGLGLPIVKSLVDAMGGTIEVKSELGKGTEFKVELYVPLAEVPDNSPESVCDKAALSGKHILLVEDNELNVYVAKAVRMQEDDAYRIVLGFRYIDDIVEEEERQKKLLAIAAEQARKSNEAKTEFLRRMSHDIRTPINGVMGMLKMAENHMDDKQRTQDCIEKAMAASKQLLHLVNDILDISKLEANDFVAEEQPFDLMKFGAEQQLAIDAYAAQYNVTINSGRDMVDISHRYVVGSQELLNRVLMNLVSNAVKYNRPGGSVSISCREMSSSAELAFYQFVCEDTGIGMSEEFIKRAYEPYAQEGDYTNTTFSGTGLGLSIVKRIVAQLDGSIKLESKKNVGTRVVVTLPFRIDHAAHKEEKTVNLPVDLSGKKALIVEDNDLNREITEALLEELHVETEVARDGREAVDVFNASPVDSFDFILMDIMMPVMDGLEATRQIRNLAREDSVSVPILALSANAFEDDVKRSLDAGMNAHLTKPLDVKKAIQELQNVLKLQSRSCFG